MTGMNIPRYPLPILYGSPVQTIWRKAITTDREFLFEDGQLLISLPITEWAPSRTLLGISSAGFFQPFVQDTRETRRHFCECQAHPLLWLEIDHGRMGLQKFRLGIDLHQYVCALRKWINHFHIAAVQTQVADSCGRTHAFPLVNDVGRGNERMPGRSASFRSHGYTPIWGGVWGC